MSDAQPSKSRRYLSPEQPASGEGKWLIMAIGDTGRRIAKHLPDSYSSSILYIDTDLSNTSYQTLQIGPSTCKGIPICTPERGIRSAMESLEEIEDHLSGVSSLTLVGRLGGGTCSGALPVIYDLALSLGITTNIAVMLPLKVEKERRQTAELVLKQLQSKCRNLSVVDLSEIEFGTNDTPTLKDAFIRANNQLAFYISDHQYTEHSI